MRNMLVNPNDCAFAVAYTGGHAPGLTKREYFAIMALQGLLSFGKAPSRDSYTLEEMSVDWADSLIDQLNKEI